VQGDQDEALRSRGGPTFSARLYIYLFIYFQSHHLCFRSSQKVANRYTGGLKHPYLYSLFAGALLGFALHPSPPFAGNGLQNAFFGLKNFDVFGSLTTDIMHRDLLGIMPTMIELMKAATSPSFISELDSW
jgi:hypothetical protein